MDHGPYSGDEPRATVEAVRMGKKKMFASSAKAERDLGFQVLPVDSALRAAIDWFRAHGYAPDVMSARRSQSSRCAAARSCAAGTCLAAPIVSSREGTGIWESDEAIVVCAGMGRDRVTRALELAESSGPLRSVISVGYAGALRQGMRDRRRYWPAIVIDAADRRAI